MKYTIVNTEELLAALKPSQFRPFKDAILKKEFKNYLNHIFKDKDRIYLPFEMENTVKIPKKIERYLSTKNLEIVDYKAGIAKNEKGKLAKIGKALSKDEEGKKLLDLFNTSRSGVNKKNSLMIVISRHPYDIAGMSTGRGRDEPGDGETGWGWSSCMNLRSGENRVYVTHDIDNGTLISYIIDSDDENINKPISRLLIKQYINIENEKDTILYPDERIYGENVKGFREKIIDWIKNFQELKGTYELNDNLYPDREEGTEEGDVLYLGHGDKNHELSQIRELYYKNNPEDISARDDNDDYFRVRRQWYSKHPEDKKIKSDKHEGMRYDYYERNPEDEDAKKDPDYYIRKMYYENHPKDKDMLHDSDPRIKEMYFKNNPLAVKYETNDNYWGADVPWV